MADPIINSTAPAISTLPTLTPAPVKKSGGFGSFMRSLAAGAASFIPGVGGILGGIINGIGRGGIGAGIGMGNDTMMSDAQAMLIQSQKQSMEMLQIQQQVSSQTQSFTTMSNLLKSKHDSEMSAVNNFKS